MDIFDAHVKRFPKMGRKKRLPDDAEPITIYLTPEDQMVLHTIRLRRKKRSEGRDSPSEIVSDGLSLIFTEREKLTKDQIAGLLQVESKTADSTEKIRQFRKKDLP
jgi:hypothetical protein